MFAWPWIVLLVITLWFKTEYIDLYLESGSHYNILLGLPGLIDIPFNLLKYCIVNLSSKF